MRTSASLVFLLAACGGSASLESGPPTVRMMTPVGQPQGPEVALAIGPAGGTLTSDDGELTVTVPAGAVAEATTFTVQAVANETTGGLGLAYRLGPEGQTFQTPISLRFAVDPEAVESVKIVFQRADGGWSPVGVKLRAQDAVVIETTHFSLWARTTGLRLSPLQATVGPGEELYLQLESCVERPLDCQVESDPVCEFYCYGQGEIVVPGVTWAVNGVEWGNDALGKIQWGDSTGRGAFRAPSQAPSPRTVQVSASCDPDECGARIIVFSNVTISDHPGYRGTVDARDVSDTGVGVVTTVTHAMVTFSYDEEQAIYTPSDGTVTITYDFAGLDCAVHMSFTGPLGPLDGTLQVGDGTYVGFGHKVDALLTGTSTCNGTHTPTPVSLLNASPWWPGIGSNLYQVDDDGSLSESVMTTTAMRTVTASWALAPL